jgi:hypothetical protein
MLLCWGRKQERQNVFSHILEFWKKEALDEQKGGAAICLVGLRVGFSKKKGGKRKGGNCDHFESLSAGVGAFTAFSN